MCGALRGSQINWGLRGGSKEMASRGPRRKMVQRRPCGLAGPESWKAERPIEWVYLAWGLAPKSLRQWQERGAWPGPAESWWVHFLKNISCNTPVLHIFQYKVGREEGRGKKEGREGREGEGEARGKGKVGGGAKAWTGNRPTQAQNHQSKAGTFVSDPQSQESRVIDPEKNCPLRFYTRKPCIAFSSFCT